MRTDARIGFIMQLSYNAANSAAPNTIMRIIPMQEIIRPAMDKPLGFLNTPINENKNPRNQRM